MKAAVQAAFSFAGVGTGTLARPAERSSAALSASFKRIVRDVGRIYFPWNSARWDALD
jgi:hypothetical protein